MAKAPKTSLPANPRFVSLDGEPVSPALFVQDANTLKEFLANAKVVWLEHSVEAVRGKGRPSARSKVIQALWREKAVVRLAGGATQGKLIGLVKKRLGSGAPSTEAIRKYVKMWTILQKNHGITPGLFLPSADRQWLNKHAPKLMRVLRAYDREIHALSGEQLDRVIETGLIDPSMMPATLIQHHKLYEDEVRDFKPPADIPPQ